MGTDKHGCGGARLPASRKMISTANYTNHANASPSPPRTGRGWGEVSNPKQKTFDANFTNYREFKCAEGATEISLGLARQAEIGLVAPKSDVGGCEPALGKSPANFSLSAFASEANGEQRQRLWRVRCVRNFISPPQGLDADSKQNQFRSASAPAGRSHDCNGATILTRMAVR